MRVGLATSLVAHAVLITLGVIGLHNAEELAPTPVEAISVDLVPIEEVASIRAGSENSTVIETPKPAAVDSPKPEDPAERPGATEKDQPTPEETATPSPAPTVQTAPEPVPVPEPEPQTEPVPEETPPAEQAPELAAAPEPEAEPPKEAPAPVPAMRTASVQRQQAQAKPTPAQTEKPKETKPADQVADIINSETSRGSTTGSGGEAAAGKPTGQAQRLTQSELGALIAQMQRCWNPSLQDRNDGVVFQLMVAMNPDGTVNGVPQVLTDVSTSPTLGLAARAAARKIATCGPFDLPKDKYDHWQQIDVTLDASQAN